MIGNTLGVLVIRNAHQKEGSPHILAEIRRRVDGHGNIRKEENLPQIRGKDVREAPTLPRNRRRDAAK